MKKKIGIIFISSFISLIFLSVVIFSRSSNSDTYKQLELFGDVFEKVQSDYVEESDEAILIESAINGMLNSLDPHSKYLNPKNLKEMRIQTRGEFGGLGIEVTMENGFVKVIAPIDDTPAYRAGIKAGDFITHLDGKPILGLSLSQAVDLMRGLINTKITLTIQRSGLDSAFDVSIIRDKIKIGSVKTRLEGEDIVYIRITSFSERTTDDLEKSVGLIFEEKKESLVGLVLDLRNNPGGLLDQAISVADSFLDKGEIVSTRGRRNDSIQRFNARNGDIAKGLPIIVLINGGSASASEIVAGAIQDHNRGLIIGTRSFGKGSVQTIIPLREQGAIRLTTARYFTPSGRSIQAKGIEPDLLVEPARIEKLSEKSQRESDLRGSLDVVKTETENNKEKNINNESNEQEDYQLLRAFDLLRGFKLLSIATRN
ncbi:MAG: peptidase S41 [Rhodospirillaceae bacterium]|nr:peptidase S41 [Alphaproteobacteria bacterium]MBR71624.1 peptidase S41 [Rhodospirillaceae bacterium]|tara:strand:- start:404 stop:1687 length:1284 start_codon:yes stop_codon:yes gene_type:complete